MLGCEVGCSNMPGQCVWHRMRSAVVHCLHQSPTALLVSPYWFAYGADHILQLSIKSQRTMQKTLTCLFTVVMTVLNQFLPLVLSWLVLNQFLPLVLSWLTTGRLLKKVSNSATNLWVLSSESPRCSNLNRHQWKLIAMLGSQVWEYWK